MFSFYFLNKRRKKEEIFLGGIVKLFIMSLYVFYFCVYNVYFNEADRYCVGNHGNHGHADGY